MGGPGPGGRNAPRQWVHVLRAYIQEPDQWVVVAETRKWHVGENLPNQLTIIISVVISGPRCKIGYVDQIRLAIVDDHSAYRNSLRLVLEREPDIRVVGMAGDGLAAIEIVGELHPDVVLIDVRLPQMNGIEATRIITSKHPQTTVIAMTLFPEDGTGVAALEAGACNYWSKESHFQGLRATIGCCLSRQQYHHV